MSNRFDFSKIDEALPGAEKMQREERLANTLEDNYKAVHALCDMVEKLENRLLEALSENGRGCFFPATGKQSHRQRGNRTGTGTGRG